MVSDLVRGRPIWFGGQDRSEASLDEFFAGLGPRKCRKIRVAVMDMGKAFRNSTLKEGHAPQARIIYDKFHVMSHLGKAMDEVRQAGVRPPLGEGPPLHQGAEVQPALPPGEPHHRGQAGAEAAVPGQQAVAYGLPAEGVVRPTLGLQPRRLGAAVLRALEGRLEVATPGALFRKFAAMVESHWDGIEAYCREENKVPLGFVEGLNNKIRAIQRRAYGYRDEEYFRLKILTCMLPKL